MDRPEDVGSAWDAALAADRPVVLEAYTSGEVPTLPPHITFEQAKNYMSSLVKVDPEEGGIIKQSVKDMIAGVTSRRGKEERRDAFLEGRLKNVLFFLPVFHFFMMRCLGVASPSLQYDIHLDIRTLASPFRSVVEFR